MMSFYIENEYMSQSDNSDALKIANKSKEQNKTEPM